MNARCHLAGAKLVLDGAHREVIFPPVRPRLVGRRRLGAYKVNSTAQRSGESPGSIRQVSRWSDWNTMMLFGISR
jgi:hypothetical protein